MSLFVLNEISVENYPPHIIYYLCTFCVYERLRFVWCLVSSSIIIISAHYLVEYYSATTSVVFVLFVSRTRKMAHLAHHKSKWMTFIFFRYLLCYVCQNMHIFHFMWQHKSDDTKLFLLQFQLKVNFLLKTNGSITWNYTRNGIQEKQKNYVMRSKAQIIMYNNRIIIDCIL